MEQPNTDWLGKEFLEQCLRNEKRNQNIEVTDFNASLAVPVGNNYGACVARVKVEYKESKEDNKLQSISIIVKSELTEGPFQDIANRCIEPKEPIFYNKFLPEASKLSEIDFVPKTLFSPKPTVIIMEDLKEQGFVMADRLKQLDFDHCRLYMEAAASFHAVSFAAHKKDPKLIEALGEDLYLTIPRTKEMYGNMIKNGFNCLANATVGFERFRKYSKLIEDVSVNIFEKVIEIYKINLTLNTLIQYDPWITNMMFKYDDKKSVKEVRLLDFQALRYSCPLIDLVYFVWSSATHDVRRNRLNDLYKIYLDVFNLKLQELNCSERITFEDFMDVMRNLSLYVIYVVATMLPFIHDPEPVDLGFFLQTDDERREKNPYENLYTESFCNSHISKYLEDLELHGVFEYLERHNNLL